MKSYLFPGQGSQRVGMGAALFDAFPDITATADAVLGYSIKDLCLEDRNRQLGQTQYTQCALYVVNALAHRQRARETGERADFVAGHSLGEYNALECAGAMRFEDGLRLVKKRGELMSAAPKGTMAAIIGPAPDKVAAILAENGLTAIDVANYNAANQIIISGPVADIRNAQSFFEAQQAMFMPLNVSGAFHSRYMQAARDAFAVFLEEFRFSDPEIPVIANITGAPYAPGEVARNLADQITHSVRWLDGMTFMLRAGVTEFIELGPGEVLTKLAKTIKRNFDPDAPVVSVSGDVSRPKPAPAVNQPRRAESPQQRVAEWNAAYGIGTEVRVKGYSQPLRTKTQAVVLFGHRAAVYMQGYNGYFALDEVEPVASAAVGAVA